MAGKPRPIAIEEWLAELVKHGPKDAEGFTRQDLEQALGITEQAAGEWLRQWGRRGLVEFSGYVVRLRIDGRPCQRPAYQVTKKLPLTAKRGRGK